MSINWTITPLKGKKTLSLVAMAGALLVSACSVNPATGDRQFTALLPTASEGKIGAQEHTKVQAQFGTFMTGPISDYVNEVGQRVAAHTERKDISYKFYVLDTRWLTPLLYQGAILIFLVGF